MYFLRNLNTVDPINLHANVFILGINKNTTKYAVYGCLQTVIIAFIYYGHGRTGIITRRTIPPVITVLNLRYHLLASTSTDYGPRTSTMAVCKL